LLKKRTKEQTTNYKTLHEPGLDMYEYIGITERL